MFEIKGIYRIALVEAYSETRQKYVEALSFSVAHCLEAHRLLGFIMRARLQTYPELARIRRQGNRETMVEPTSVNEVPA